MTLAATFELEGQEVHRLHAAAKYKFNEGDFQRSYHQRPGQEEVDYFWNRLIAGGGEVENARWMAQGQVQALCSGLCPRPSAVPKQSHDRKNRRACKTVMKMPKIRPSPTSTRHIWLIKNLPRDRLETITCLAHAEL